MSGEELAEMNGVLELLAGGYRQEAVEIASELEKGWMARREAEDAFLRFVRNPKSEVTK